MAVMLCVSACGGAETAEPGPVDPEAEPETAGGVDEGLPEPDDASRETWTAEECESQGGEVVGDIGDGAVHRPDFVCPSGEMPLAEVPLGVEGAVCCPPG